MKNEILYHQDLFLGSVWKVPLGFQKPVATAVKTAVAQSAKEKVFVQIVGTPFFIKSDHKYASDGNATIHIGCEETLGGGKVPANTLLYSATVSCEEASRPLAWRFLFNEYLAYALASPEAARFNAPPPMFRGSTPVLTGFSRLQYARLTKDERETLLTVLWLAALDLLRICQQAVHVAKMAGSFPEPDPELFLELRDWSR